MKKAELKRALAEAGDGTGQVDIDSVIDASNPLHRQLLNNYAQDLACDDEIYVLGKFLMKHLFYKRERFYYYY